MLKRVKIQGYKSLTDVEVNLTPLCVLFGPNAAGKSNFLDALQLLSRIAASRTISEAFTPPHRGKPIESFSFGPDGVPGLIAQESASFSMEVDVELSPRTIESVYEEIKFRRTPPDTVMPQIRQKQHLRYGIKIETRPQAGKLQVVDEYLFPLNENGEKDTRQSSSFATQQGFEDHLHVFWERVGEDQYDKYPRLRDYSILSKSFDPVGHPHLIAMQAELESWRFFYFEPRERMHASQIVEEVREIGMMGERLAPFLNTLKAVNEPQFRAIEKALHLMIPSITGIDVGVNNSTAEVELKLREGNTLIPSRLVSEGTLRILGLLALVGANGAAPTLVGFEEPENGVHPRRIRQIASLLKTRAGTDTQMIVTTHSPVLLDLLPESCLYLCRKHDGDTVIEPFCEADSTWRNASIDSALDDEGDDLMMSERILRGDFDA